MCVSLKILLCYLLLTMKRLYANERQERSSNFSGYKQQLQLRNGIITRTTFCSSQLSQRGTSENTHTHICTHTHVYNLYIIYMTSTYHIRFVFFVYFSVFFYFFFALFATDNVFVVFQNNCNLTEESQVLLNERQKRDGAFWLFKHNFITEVTRV